uniref:Uncharacterized protein n=1 Tax=Helianthus annuus TaxID=4232 RepID=A0A251SFK1_HELAN
MIIEKVNEQLLRLFWGFKTLTLTRSWTLEHLVVHRSHFKKVHLREIDRQRVATIARQRQRERGAAEMEEPAIVSRRPPSWPSVRRWWVVVVSLYRKREAEESKDRETRGHTAPTQSTASTVVLGSPVTAPTVNSRVPSGG